jgi:hypothetical protein
MRLDSRHRPIRTADELLAAAGAREVVSGMLCLFPPWRMRAFARVARYRLLSRKPLPAAVIARS